MNTAIFVIGCSIAGWLLPEFLLLMSTRDGIQRIPMGMNLLTTIASAMIAYGVCA